MRQVLRALRSELQPRGSSYEMLYQPSDQELQVPTEVGSSAVMVAKPHAEKPPIIANAGGDMREKLTVHEADALDHNMCVVPASLMLVRLAALDHAVAADAFRRHR